MSHRTRQSAAAGRSTRLGRAGLTLIELAVVTSIVAAAVMVTAPALTEVTRRSRLACCQLQTRSLGTALAGVAAERGGQLPAGPVQRVWTGSPHELYRRNAAAAFGPTDGWFGLGQTWRLGFVSTGESFYCPEGPRHGDVGYEQAWPTSVDTDRNPADGKFKIYCSYAYRGGLAGAAEESLAPLNVHRIGSGAAVLADNPIDGRMWHEQGYNVAAVDGSVRLHAADGVGLIDGYLPAFWLAVEAEPTPDPR